MFFAYFNNYKEKQLNVGRLSYFIGNTLNTDVTNVEMLKLNQRFDVLYSKYQKATSFIKPQLDDLSLKKIKIFLECCKKPLRTVQCMGSGHWPSKQ